MHARSVGWKSARGFSLVELLVVIAVIAIIASLTVPSILEVSNNANAAKDRRNAQNAALVAGAAKAVGVTNDLSGTNAIAILQPPGISVIRNGSELSFSVSAMTESEQALAAAHLTNNVDPNGAVIYISEP